MTVATAKKLEKEVRGLKKEVAILKAAFFGKRLNVRKTITLSIDDFEDIVEELDPEFQKSLKGAYKEYRNSKTIALRDYTKRR